MKEMVARNSANQNYSLSRLPTFSLAEKRLLKGANDVVFLNYYSTYTITTSTYNSTPSYENDRQVTTGYRSEWNVTNIGFPVKYFEAKKFVVLIKTYFRFTIQECVAH